MRLAGRFDTAGARTPVFVEFSRVIGAARYISSANTFFRAASTGTGIVGARSFEAELGENFYERIRMWNQESGDGADPPSPAPHASPALQLPLLA